MVIIEKNRPVKKLRQSIYQYVCVCVCVGLAVYFEQGLYDECIKECEEAVEIGREHRADFKLIAKWAAVYSAYSVLAL